MSYEEAITYLNTRCPSFTREGKRAYQPGLTTAYQWLEHLGYGHTIPFKTIHVAGTNGKGSVSHLIASVLQCAGYNVGLFTSPHLLDFGERIRINGVKISQTFVSQFVETHQEYIQHIGSSFFITTMAMAFDYFAREHVDVVVIETGIGGLNDSTNIITPLLSIITNVGWDHTDVLGTTLPAIASQKVGIMKPHVPCVVGEYDDTTAPVFIERAKECGIWGEGLETATCQFFFANQCNYLRTRYNRLVGDCQLKGNYQYNNVQTAYVAICYLQRLFTIPQSAINEGYAHVCDLTGLRGRMETLIQGKYHYLLDIGHNVPAFTYTSQYLQTLPHLRIIFGMMGDKDVSAVMPLLPDKATYYITNASSPRAMKAHDLLTLFQHYHPTTPATAYNSVFEALQAVQRDYHNEEVIFVGGSNYVVAEVLEHLS